MAVLSANDLLSSVKASTVDPFHATSLFINPSSAGLSQMGDIHSQLSALGNIPGVDPSITAKVGECTAAMADYTSTIAQNTTDRIKNISSDLPKVLAAGNIQSALNAADGVPSAPCQMIEDIFGTVKNVGGIIAGTIAKITGALESVLYVIVGGVATAINAAMSLINDALNTVLGHVNDALTEFQSMVAAELSKLNDIIGDLMGFSFLKSLLNTSICGHQLLGTVMDTSSVNMGMVASL